jgi:hypothetical protein
MFLDMVLEIVDVDRKESGGADHSRIGEKGKI